MYFYGTPKLNTIEGKRHWHALELYGGVLVIIIHVSRTLPLSRNSASAPNSTSGNWLCRSNGFDQAYSPYLDRRQASNWSSSMAKMEIMTVEVSR